jgi:ribosomal protein S17E
MGKIKSKQVRKAAKILTKENVTFSGSFGKNKNVLKGLVVSKKIRNQIAGLLAKSKKRELAVSSQ